MTLKRAVFVTTKAAETYRQGSVGFVRAIRYIRPDMLLDTRAIARYDFGNLNRASALKLEPGMRFAFFFSEVVAEVEPELTSPPSEHEGDWHAIIMVDHSAGSPDVESRTKGQEMMARWANAGWVVSEFDPQEDYEPLRAATPTEDRSNPLAVDAKIEGLRKQVAGMSQRLKALEESEHGAKPSYYEDLQRKNEGEAALQAVLAKEEMPTPPSGLPHTYLFRDVEYMKPSVLMKMALSATTHGLHHVALRTSGIRRLGEVEITQTLVLKDTDFLWTLDAIDTQTETVPHNPAEAWDLLNYTLLTKNIPHVLFGGSSTEAVQGLLKLAEGVK